MKWQDILLIIVVGVFLILSYATGYLQGSGDKANVLGPMLDSCNVELKDSGERLANLYLLVDSPFERNYIGLNESIVGCKNERQDLRSKLLDVNSRAELCGEKFVYCSWATSFWSSYDSSVKQVGFDGRDYYTFKCLDIVSGDWNFIVKGKR